MGRSSNNTSGSNPVLWTMLALCAFCGPVASAADTPAIYSGESVKAAFVFRFAGYITWPENSLPPDKFVIAVLGANEVALNLQALLDGRQLRNRSVEVRRVTSIKEAADAQILYVGGNHPGELKALLSRPAGRGTLVITDEGAGLASGSSINLLIVDQRVRFEISVQAARRAGLDISSDLLALAVRVRE